MPWLISRILFYPTLLWNLLLRRIIPSRHWWDRVDEHVIVGALPFSSDVQAMYAEGVRAVVNTCEEYGGPAEAYRQAGITQLRIPTVDFNPPSLSHIESAVNFIREHAAQGESVYVHCKAGRGRSATVVMCWLMAKKGLPPEKAQEFLQTKRPHVVKELWRREVVQEFARKLG